MLVHFLRAFDNCLHQLFSLAHTLAPSLSFCRPCHNEQQVRGDKGVKAVKAVDTTSYIGRAGTFAYPHLPLILLAVACLLATSAISLWLPRLNGEIIDSIIHDKRGEFKRVIQLFVALSAVYGFLSGAWQFLFRVVGAKMAVGIRDKLFSQVIKQDVA